MGGFTSTDPAEQYWHAYSYCGGDPVNYIDPNGEDATGAIIGLIGGAAIAGGVTYALTGDIRAAGWMTAWGAVLGGGIGGYGITANGLGGELLQGVLGAANMGVNLSGMISKYSMASESGWPDKPDPQHPDMSAGAVEQRGNNVLYTTTECHDNAYYMYTGKERPDFEVRDFVSNRKPDISFPEGRQFDYSELDPKKNYYWTTKSNGTIYHSGVIVAEPQPTLIDRWLGPRIRPYESAEIIKKFIRSNLGGLEFHLFTW